MDIERRFQSSEIDQDFYILLLATLLKAVDKVANTASVYCAYLKTVKTTATKNLQLLAVKRTSLPHPDCQIFNLDSSELITQVKGDILYLDPPYNGREYGSYYHLFEIANSIFSLFNISLNCKFLIILAISLEASLGIKKKNTSVNCDPKDFSSAI